MLAVPAAHITCVLLVKWSAPSSRNSALAHLGVCTIALQHQAIGIFCLSLSVVYNCERLQHGTRFDKAAHASLPTAAQGVFIVSVPAGKQARPVVAFE